MRHFRTASDRLVGAGLFLAGRRWFPALMVCLLVMASGAGAFAQDSGSGSGTAVTVQSFLDPTTLSSSIVSVGGALFVAAAGIVLGIRYGKKAIVWASSKI